LSETNGHSGGIYAVSWSGDSQQLLTASADKTAKVWNASNGQVSKTFTFSDNPQLEHQQLGCLWQGDDLLSVSLGGEVTHLDINNPSQPKRVIRGHNKFITALVVDSKDKCFYTASYDGFVLKWNATTGDTQRFVGSGHTNQVKRLLLQGKNLVSSALDDSIRFTPTSNLEYGQQLSFDSAPVDIAVGMKDHSLVVTVVTDGIVVVRNGKVASKMATSYQPQCVALSVGENQVAVGGNDNLVHLYNLSGSTLSDGAVLKGNKGPLTRVAYSPDGTSLAASDQAREIIVFNLSNNQIKIEGWVFHVARVNDLAWTSDSLHLASASLDGALYVWSVQSPLKRVAIKDAHRGGANNVGWLDDNTLFSSGQDCSVKSWSITHH